MMEKSEILKALMKQDLDDIEYFEKILNESDEHINYPDIFSETVSKIFRLVIAGKIDPWSVDISGFKDLFYKEKNDNFEVAGILISSAWHILYEKSIEIAKSEDKNENTSTGEEIPVDDSEIIPDQDPLPELNPPIFHRESAKVTLVELLNTMKNKFKEKVKHENVDNEDESIDLEDDIISKSNIDTIEDGIKSTMEKIKDLMNPFFVEDYWGNSKSEKTSFLLYLLFLERSGKISMEQTEINGNISVTKYF